MNIPDIDISDIDKVLLALTKNDKNSHSFYSTM